MLLTDVVAWLPAVAFVLAVLACIAMRDLLTGTLSKDQLRSLSPVMHAWHDDPARPDMAAHARAAQRSQWAALAFLALMMGLGTRSVAWFIEGHTAPGVAWICGMLSAMGAAMSAADAIIHTITPYKHGHSGVRRFVVANHWVALTCALVVVVPWLIQRPGPRGSALDEYVGYYQETIGSFISTTGGSVYFLIATAIIGIPCWRAAQRERDQVVRTSLRIVAAAELAAVVTIVVPQCAQSLSWTLGHPLWNEYQSTIVFMAGLMITSGLSTLGSVWAPLADSHRTRNANFLVPVWRSDVLSLRPAWRLLRQLYDGAYEATADMVTATNPADLLEQRNRIANELHDMLVVISQYLSAEGRRQALALTVASTQLSLRHRLLRHLAAWLCPALTALGGLAPRQATRAWHFLTQVPLSPFAPTDAACARAAVDVMRTGGRPALHPVPILTPTAWSTDELVGYLRLVSKAAVEARVQEAGTGAFVRMARL